MEWWNNLVKVSSQGLEPSNRRWIGLKVSLIGWVLGLAGAGFAFFNRPEVGWVFGMIGGGIFCFGVILVFIAIIKSKSGQTTNKS